MNTLQSCTRPVKRRQYHSCDRCRKGRRACDSVVRGVDPFHAGQQGDGRQRSCSQCLRARMQCTFEWLRTVPEESLPRLIKQRAHTRRGISVQERTVSPQGPAAEGQATNSVSAISNGVGQAFFDLDWTQPFASMASVDSGHYEPAASNPTWPEAPLDVGLIPGSPLPGVDRETTTSQIGDCSDLSGGLASPYCYGSSSQAEVGSGVSFGPIQNDFAWEQASTIRAATPDCQISQGDLHYGQTAVNVPFAATNAISGQWQESISSQENRLAQCTTKSGIICTFRQVYEGCIELALQCWTTELNCPYELRKQTYHHHDLSISSSTISMDQRMRQLDLACDPLRERTLSANERKRASRALQLSIMAFASQWSHPVDDSSLTQVHETSVSLEASSSRQEESLANEFGLNLRLSLWHETQRQLHLSRKCNSFQVIMAGFVFAMMQPPLHEGCSDAEPEQQDQASPSRGFSAADSFGMALRNLRAWKKRISSPLNGRDNSVLLNTGSMQSFNMIFWLGVMGDTTSSVLQGHDPIIPSEDTVLEPYRSEGVIGTASTFALHGESPQEYGSPERDDKTDLWGSYLLSATIRPWELHIVSERQRERFLQEAIPVKVLLWRKAGAIQRAFSTATSAKEVERRIDDALRVCMHWNATYGHLLEDCLAQHHSLSFKVQSWYVLLAAHWHLGCLRMAGFIQQIDEQGRSEGLQRALRQSSSLVYEMQKASACTIASVARICCQKSTSLQHRVEDCSPGHAVLLSEPWTDVLQQALTLACQTSLDWYDQLRQGGNGSTHCAWISANMIMQESVDHAESCIKALIVLGRKSEQSTEKATELRHKLRLAMEPSQSYGHDSWVGTFSPWMPRDELVIATCLRRNHGRDNSHVAET